MLAWWSALGANEVHGPRCVAGGSGLEEGVHGLLDAARRLDVSAQLRPGREAVLPRDHPLRLGQLQLCPRADGRVHPLNRPGLASEEPAPEVFRQPLEVLEVGRAGRSWDCIGTSFQQAPGVRVLGLKEGRDGAADLLGGLGPFRGRVRPCARAQDRVGRAAGQSTAGSTPGWRADGLLGRPRVDGHTRQLDDRPAAAVHPLAAPAAAQA
jgi:hypothetical protein